MYSDHFDVKSKEEMTVKKLVRNSLLVKLIHMLFEEQSMQISYCFSSFVAHL